MAGIYIPGMEMPTGKDVLTIAIQSDGEVLSIGFDSTIDGGIFLSHPNTFPIRAIPVPDHGRMIDAEAFEKDNAYFWNRDFINPKYEDCLCDLVNAAKTIIPADKEGE